MPNFLGTFSFEVSGIIWEERDGQHVQQPNQILAKITAFFSIVW